MLFLREILAFLQLTFLPGLLLVGLIRPRIGVFRTSILIFGLSPVLNYCVALMLWQFKCFSPCLIWIYIVCELLLIILVWRNGILKLLNSHPSEKFLDIARYLFHTLREWCAELSTPQRIYLIFALSCGMLGLFSYLTWIYDAFDNIFMLWDVALSWNRWAAEWYENIFPTRSYEYPQMIPLNWAMAYMLIGEKIQFAPKFAISFFPLLTLLLFFERGLTKRSLSMLGTVPFLAFFFYNVNYAMFGADLDLVVAFYSVASFFCILYAGDSEDSSGFFRCLLTVSILLCASALTKQAGLYLLFIMPFAAFFILRRKFSELEISIISRFRILLVHVILIALLVAPYYMLIQYRIGSGKSSSNIHFVTERIYGERSHLDRFLISGRLFMLKMEGTATGIRSARWEEFNKEKGYIHALILLYRQHLPLGIILLCVNMILLFYALKSPLCRYMLLFIVLPYYLIWSIFYCYDLRNLSLAIPFIAFGVSCGFTNIMKQRFVKRLPAMPLWSLVLLAIFLILLTHPEYLCDSSRRRQYYSKEMDIGVPSLNRKLLEYHDSNPSTLKIATDYEYFNLISALNGLLSYEEFSIHSELEWESYNSLFTNREIGYILIPSYSMERIHEDVVRRLEEGSLKLIFSEDVYRFIKILRHDGETND